ncbi:MAG: hypothetical protein K6E71_08845 [Lachnospiraceae bacterium]|nr:hypothetical protein [Lachnospiraceae bacterium]
MKDVFSVLIKREYRRFFSSRLFGVLFFSVSCLIGVFACIMYRVGDDYDSQNEVGVFVESSDVETRRAVSDALEDCNDIRVLYEDFSKRRILTGEFIVAIVVNEDISIVYDSSRLAKVEPVYYAQDLTARIALSIHNSSLFREYCETADVNEIDVSSPVERLQSQPMWLLTFFSMIAGIGMGTIISIVVGNSFKDEVDQGTFDLLRQAMDSPKVIVIAKILFVKSIVIISSMLAFIGFVVSTRVLCVQEWSLFNETIGKRWDRVLIVGLAFLMAMQIACSVTILGQSTANQYSRNGVISLISTIAAPGSLLLFLYFDIPFEKILPGFNLWALLDITVEQKALQGVFTISLLLFVLIEAILIVSSIYRVERSVE